MTTETMAPAAETGTALTVTQRAALALGAAEHETKLQELAKQATEIVEIKDKVSYDQCHGTRMSLKRARIAIEQTGKTAREDAQAFSKAVIAEERRLIGIIEPEENRLQRIQEAHDAEIARQKEEAARAERARVERIQLAIRDIRGSLIDVAGRSSDAIKEKLQTLVALEIGPATFNEFALEADAARTDVLAKLREMHDTVQAQEAETRRLADERAEFERQRIEQSAEQKRREDDAARVSGIRAEIESIAALPVRLIGRGSAVIEPYLQDLKERAIHEDEFGEFVSEAAGARATAVEQIESMLNDARAREQVQADQVRVDAERKRLADEEEERQRAARREQEERERQERLALEAREREERELLEAAQRRRDEEERAERLVVEERAACERAALREIEDADEMLRAFRSRFGANKRYANVVKAIDNYFKPKQPRARQKQPAAASAP